MSDSGTTCPVCAAAAQRGQLVCLECGSRITLGYRRPPSWKVPVAITAAVLVLAGAGGALGYQAVDDEAKREVAATPANPKESAAPPATDAQSTEEAKPPRDRGAGKEDDEVKLGNDQQSAEDDLLPGDGDGGDGGDDAPAADTGGGLSKRGDLYVWPRSLRAFTVVLLSAEDRPSALNFARSAGESGNDKIGVIRSNDFDTLPRGFFVVFAGEYPDRSSADRAAQRLGGRFNGAFAQLVRK